MEGERWCVGSFLLQQGAQRWGDSFLARGGRVERGRVSGERLAVVRG